MSSGTSKPKWTGRLNNVVRRASRSSFGRSRASSRASSIHERDLSDNVSIATQKIDTAPSVLPFPVIPAPPTPISPPTDLAVPALGGSGRSKSANSASSRLSFKRNLGSRPSSRAPSIHDPSPSDDYFITQQKIDTSFVPLSPPATPTNPISASSNGLPKPKWAGRLNNVMRRSARRLSFSRNSRPSSRAPSIYERDSSDTPVATVAQKIDITSPVSSSSVAIVPPIPISLPTNLVGPVLGRGGRSMSTGSVPRKPSFERKTSSTIIQGRGKISASSVPEIAVRRPVKQSPTTSTSTEAYPSKLTRTFAPKTPLPPVLTTVPAFGQTGLGSAPETQFKTSQPPQSALNGFRNAVVRTAPNKSRGSSSGAMSDATESEPITTSPSLEIPARLLSRLSHILKTPELRNDLCRLEGDNAQLMVDFLHSLLLETSLPIAWLRKHSLIALYKLSRASLLYPHCYSLKDITIGSHETGGTFSEVYKGRHGEEQLCLKVIRLRRKSDIDALLKIYAKEAILWGQLNHSNIVPFYGVYYLNGADRRLCLVSPWMQNGNLVDYLKNNPTTPRIPFIYDIITGLKYLHDQDLVHSDIKGANILVNDSQRACIADFGLSFIGIGQTIAYTLESNTARGFSHHWAAPELLDDDACATMASDVWALGGVCFEVLTGSPPFKGLTEAQIIRKLIKGEKPTRPDRASQSTWAENVIWELADRCWTTKPEARPTCRELAQELENKGLAREQENLKHIPQGKRRFWDMVRRSEVVPVDLIRVEDILNDVVGS